MAKKCVQAIVSGKVQGVWYRQSTREMALSYKLTGWAKNLPDGRVEVRLCGDSDNVAVVLEWLAKGPEHAIVEHVQSNTVAYEALSGFTTV